MKKLLFLTIFNFLFLPQVYAQSLFAALDWNMAAVVSSSDYTNGASDGAPSLTLGADFGFAAVEAFYKRYKLEQKVENSIGETDVLFEDNIFGIGARFTHNIFFLSRFGILVHQIETGAVNDRGSTVRFPYDGSHVGFYFGGGVQIPIGADFFFQSSINLETSTSDLTTIGMFLGFRYHFLGL